MFATIKANDFHIVTSNKIEQLIAFIDINQSHVP